MIQKEKSNMYKGAVVYCSSFSHFMKIFSLTSLIIDSDIAVIIVAILLKGISAIFQNVAARSTHHS